MAPSLYSKLASNHRAHSKLEVFKYTLASYSVIPWKGAVFYIKLDEEFQKQRQELEEYIYGLFPVNIKIYGFRLDTYEQWIEAIRLPGISNEEWIWFTCNDDHIFIDSSTAYLEKLLACASQLSSQENKDVAIFPSHWSEMLANKKRGVALNKKPFWRWHVSDAFAVLDCNYDYHLTTERTTVSIQLLTKKLLNLWFADAGRLPEDLRRTDGITPPAEQLMIVPHREMVRHFDAYSHSGVAHKIIPPMFIPAGFFDGQVKIQYGGEKRLPGYVYIHPTKPFIFQEASHKDRTVSELCDMNCLHNGVPLFWQSRISDIQDFTLSETIKMESYLRCKVREVCADPRFGYLPMEAIKELTAVFYQEFTPSPKTLHLIAKNTWNWRESLYYRWKRFNYSYLIGGQYAFLTYARIQYPRIWSVGKLIKMQITKMKILFRGRRSNEISD